MPKKSLLLDESWYYMTSWRDRASGVDPNLEFLSLTAELEVGVDEDYWCFKWNKSVDALRWDLTTGETKVLHRCGASQEFELWSPFDGRPSYVGSEALCCGRIYDVSSQASFDHWLSTSPYNVFEQVLAGERFLLILQRLKPFAVRHHKAGWAPKEITLLWKRLSRSMG